MRKKLDLEKKEDMTRKTPLVLNYSTKTWYGLPVDITVSSNNLHRISVPGLTLPHPDWLILSLAGDYRLKLAWY